MEMDESEKNQSAKRKTRKPESMMTEKDKGFQAKVDGGLSVTLLRGGRMVVLFLL
jgi:hypothetical protein